MGDAIFEARMQELRQGVAPELRPLVEFAGTELVERLMLHARQIGMPRPRAQALARRLARSLVMDFVTAHRFERQYTRE